MSTATLEFPALRSRVSGTEVATIMQDFVMGGASKFPQWRPGRTTSVTSFEGQIAAEASNLPSASFRLTGEGISGTLHSINELTNEVDEGDGYPAVPSAYALGRACNLVERAGTLVMNESPAGSASSDVNGGIRVTWRSESRELRLVIPGTPAGRGYIYLRSGSESKISEDLSLDTLAARLAWLSQE